MKGQYIDNRHLGKWTSSKSALVPWEPTGNPSFLGVIKPIYWGPKTFIFHGHLGSKGRGYGASLEGDALVKGSKFQLQLLQPKLCHVIGMDNGLQMDRCNSWRLYMSHDMNIYIYMCVCVCMYVCIN